MECAASGRSQRRAPAPWSMINRNSKVGYGLATVRKMS